MVDRDTQQAPTQHFTSPSLHHLTTELHSRKEKGHATGELTHLVTLETLATLGSQVLPLVALVTDLGCCVVHTVSKVEWLHPS